MLFCIFYQWHCINLPSGLRKYIICENPATVHGLLILTLCTFLSANLRYFLYPSPFSLDILYGSPLTTIEEESRRSHVTDGTCLSAFACLPLRQLLSSVPPSLCIPRAPFSLPPSLSLHPIRMQRPILNVNIFRPPVVRPNSKEVHISLKRELSKDDFSSSVGVCSDSEVQSKRVRSTE